MNTLFENYGQFVNEHEADLKSASGIMRLLNDRGMRSAYFETLVDGLDAGVRKTVYNILEHQAKLTLLEGASTGAANFAPGWTVLSL